MNLILASSSKYREALLARLQIPFGTVSPNINEAPIAGETPSETALRLAEAKARKVAEQHRDALLIGCDQVAALGEQQLGKPLSHDKALQQLLLMQGREVVFYSAVCLLNGMTKRLQSAVTTYRVQYLSLSRDEIENYLHREQPYHCAGSAKIEGLGIALVDQMYGDDPTTLIGLPLICLVRMLKAEGVRVI